MKKTLFTTALAFALSIFGAAAFAQTQSAVSYVPGAAEDEPGFFTSNVSKSLTLLIATPSDVNLSDNLSAVSGTDGGKTLGYTRNGGDFISLAKAVDEAKVVTVTSTDDGETKKANVTTIRLGDFTEGDAIQLGYRDSEGFHPYAPSKIEDDPGYYAGYNSENFFQLDFSQDPFDGMIEVLVMGEPLPASTVSLLVALGAGAVFLLYHNRRRRIGAVEQA